MVRYPSPTLGSLPLPISLRSLSPILAATFMPPRGRPTLVVLSLVTSSSDALFSSASSCDAAACRSLVLAASFASRRNSVLLAAYPGPSSLSSSPRARTIFLTPTPIICLQVKKERKKTDNPREGWEDGTPPPHRDFKERGVIPERQLGDTEAFSGTGAAHISANSPH